MTNHINMTEYDFFISEEEFKSEQIIKEFEKSFDKINEDIIFIYDKIDEIKLINNDHDWPTYENSKATI